MIYFDNACTSFPKPKCVIEAVSDALGSFGNINRASHSLEYKAEEMVYCARELICEFFNGPKAGNVIFTKSVTESLNTIICGLLKPGDNVLISGMEHNAVTRPLASLAKSGITVSQIPCDSEGRLLLDRFEEMITSNTTAVILTGASNVTGTVMPVQHVGKLCKKHHLKFITDAAQSAGHLPIDMNADCIDALCFTGHKGLMGPQGIGGFILTDEMVEQVKPLICGGTGSLSDKSTMPTFCPDKYEAGTLNIPGIAGLRAAVEYIGKLSLENIYDHEIKLTQHFLAGIDPLLNDNLLVKCGPHTLTDQVGVVSLSCTKVDNAVVAEALDRQYQIMTRVGLHCAPEAHKTVGTFPLGTIRFSFGFFNTEEEIDLAVSALTNCLTGGLLCL